MIEVDVALAMGGFKLEAAFQNADGITALFGHSGSGKSLTLNLIAGLLRPDRGYIRLDGNPLVDRERGVFVPPHRRRIGLVFQDSHLFPHLSVKQNLLFGRFFAPRRERAIDFDAVIETLGIASLLARHPARLSGGERQRVAIGRALLSCPKLLLFDEPLAALDMQRKLEILPLIEHVRDHFQVPIVYVSHSIEEVVRLAAFVVVLDAGKVKAIGGPAEVFGTVAAQLEETRFDRSSILTMWVSGEDASYGLTQLMHPSGTLWLAGPAGPVGTEVRVIVKATDVVLAVGKPGHLSIRNALSGRVVGLEREGALVLVETALDGGGNLFAMISRHALDELGIAPGDPIIGLIKTAALDERRISRPRPALG
ncbi:MAG TPA: molybdenum ABC transporter ATP-binding protein [Beijerinckia sp.]|jgi:molybdate transport system ATP-binding protein|nr:molybdenum ABC transporter ATP-binding protein [Beijerinckia sp.]